VRSVPLVAVACSALAGIVCGVVGGLLIDSGPVEDPLGLGVPLHNQSCTGKTLVLLGWGERRPALAAAVVKDPARASYLDTTQSCPTAWALKGRASPRYVVYLGPFDTGPACKTRITAEYRGALVTRLHSGNSDPVECTCYLPVASMPVLRVGMDVSGTDTIWIRSLQRILGDLGYLRPDRITGSYDQASMEAVKQFQSERGGIVPNGVVDADTWRSLINKGCHLYDS
jgi:hypothetical protein